MRRFWVVLSLADLFSTTAAPVVGLLLKIRVESQRNSMRP
jgi:hypothetical protein